MLEYIYDNPVINTDLCQWSVSTRFSSRHSKRRVRIFLHIRSKHASSSSLPGAVSSKKIGYHHGNFWSWHSWSDELLCWTVVPILQIVNTSSKIASIFAPVYIYKNLWFQNGNARNFECCINVRSEMPAIVWCKPKVLTFQVPTFSTWSMS